MKIKEKVVQVYLSTFKKNGNSYFLCILLYSSRRRWKNPGVTKYLSRDGSADFVLDLVVTQSPLPCKLQDMITSSVHVCVWIFMECCILMLINWIWFLVRFRYPYIVVDTDYKSYTIKYHCQQLGPVNIRKVFCVKESI